MKTWEKSFQAEGTAGAVAFGVYEDQKEGQYVRSLRTKRDVVQEEGGGEACACVCGGGRT